jgi:riboflavin kinase
MAATAARAADPAELAALRAIALDGALDGPAHVTCADLAARLDASAQTASRRLQRLEDAGLVERSVAGDGQRVRITEDGERALRREYEAYRRLFVDDRVVVTGTVTGGMGEGRHYITLPGYMEQFREKLGYEPFPGTLNVDLTAEGARHRAALDALDGVPIDGWSDEDRTYGPATCYPAAVTAWADGESAMADGQTTAEVEATPDGNARTAEAHVIAPERTHHDDDHLELIAPERLRDALPIDDGDALEIDVRPA